MQVAYVEIQLGHHYQANGDKKTAQGDGGISDIFGHVVVKLERHFCSKICDIIYIYLTNWISAPCDFSIQFSLCFDVTVAYLIVRFNEILGF